MKFCPLLKEYDCREDCVFHLPDAILFNAIKPFDIPKHLNPCGLALVMFYSSWRIESILDTGLFLKERLDKLDTGEGETSEGSDD